jgi:hypothetical protein
VWTDGRFAPGSSCETSPYNRFTWEKLGGKEGRCLDPDTGKVITKEDLANCQLQLWCWDLAADEYCVVSFSAGALRHYREFVRLIECQGVKMHSLLWKLTHRSLWTMGRVPRRATCPTSGDSARADA